MSIFKWLRKTAAKILPCAEWLAEIWALIRGLLILLLVLYSIVTSLGVSGQQVTGLNLVQDFTIVNKE